MFTVWLVQMTLVYGTFKIAKKITKKVNHDRRISKDERTRLKANEKYQANLINSKGQNISGNMEFDKLEDALKWSEQHIKKEDILKTDIQNNINGIILEPEELKFDNQIDRGNLKKLINDYEIRQKRYLDELNLGWDELIEKHQLKEIFTPNEKHSIEGDIIKFLRDGKDSIDLTAKHLQDNILLNVHLDEQLKELAKQTKVKLKDVNPKYTGDKKDIEAQAGYYQQLIADKSAIYNMIASENNLDKTYIMSADFINQPMYENHQKIKLDIKSNKKDKQFVMGIDRTKIHEEKSVRSMDLMEVRQWRKNNDMLIKASVEYATKSKFDKKDMGLYVQQAKSFVNDYDKESHKSEASKFKIAKHKEELDTSLKKVIDMIEVPKRSTSA